MTRKIVYLLGCLVSLTVAASLASAMPTIAIGTWYLEPNTPGQQVMIPVAGGDAVEGCNLNAQIGDGGTAAGGTPAPRITAVDLIGTPSVPTIFWPNHDGAGTNQGSIPQLAMWSIITNSGTVSANGLLAILTIDTTGFVSGDWPFAMGSTLNGPTDFAPISAGITDGTIHITTAPGTEWKTTTGNWGDPGCWTRGEPNGSVKADIANGGIATITQSGRSCAILTLGNSPGQSGFVNMAAGGLTSNMANVGYGGAATFTQTGGEHHVLQKLSIAAEANSVGTYDLQGGNLFAGEIVVGGSSAAKGGAGTFTISGGHAVVDGDLTIWGGSAAHLGGGSLAGPDGNHPNVDVDNSGTLYVDSGVCTLGRVAGMGDTLTGTVVVAGGATLWAESIEQDSLIVEPGGTVHLAAENYDLFMALARENQVQVPEPASLALLGLGGLALAGRRRGRSIG